VLYFYYGVGLLVFVDRPRHEASPSWHSQSGVKSKRIALVAVLLIYDPTSSGSALGQFLLFSAWLRGKPQCNASPKESVSCASAVLFLLCVSRFVLFLLSCTKLVIVFVLSI
jgi:hypothetical protein